MDAVTYNQKYYEAIKRVLKGEVSTENFNKDSVDKDIKEQIMCNILNASILTWRHVNLLGTYDFSNLISHNDNEISHEDILNYQAA